MAPLEKLILHFAIFLFTPVLSGSQTVSEGNPLSPETPPGNRSVTSFPDPQVEKCQRLLASCDKEINACSQIEAAVSCVNGVSGCEAQKTAQLQSLADRSAVMGCGMVSVTALTPSLSPEQSCQNRVTACSARQLVRASKSCRDIQVAITCVQGIPGCDSEKAKALNTLETESKENDCGRESAGTTTAATTTESSQSCKAGVRVCNTTRHTYSNDTCRNLEHYKLCLDALQGCQGSFDTEVTPLQSESERKALQAGCYRKETDDVSVSCQTQLQRCRKELKTLQQLQNSADAQCNLYGNALLCLSQMRSCQEEKQRELYDYATNMLRLECPSIPVVVPKECSRSFKRCNDSLYSALSDIRDKTTVCRQFRDFVGCVKGIQDCPDKLAVLQDLVIENTKDTLRVIGCELSYLQGTSCGVAASLPTVLVALMVALFCQHRLSGGGGWILLPLLTPCGGFLTA